MFCPNCGKRVPDDSRFCSNCGTRLNKPAVIQTEMPYGEKEGRKQEERRYVPRDRKALAEQTRRRTPVREVNDEEDGRRKPNFLIIGLILATFFASLIITIVIFSGVSKDSTAVIYLSDSKYGVIGDLESGTAIDLVGSKTDERIPNLQFCSDGKTIYFLTRYDGTSGNLNRTDFTRLRMTGGRNEELIEQIASDVAAFEACGEQNVLYSTASRTLYYYDGQESTQIGKLVFRYQTDEKGRILYAAGEDNDLTIYGAMLTDPDNRQKLVPGLTEAAVTALFDGEEKINFDHIPYLQEGALYTAGFDRQPELVAERAELGAKSLMESSVSHPQMTFLYRVPNGESIICYDHLAEDLDAAKDTVAVIPKEKDYMVPSYEIVPITDANAAEADYPELFTSCTQGLGGLNGKTLEEVSTLTGIDAGRAPAVAQTIINKYKGLANEEGLIALTEDIKADLKRLADVTGLRNWLLFCLAKQQTGTQLDEAAWNDAQESYRQAEERNGFRAMLKQEMPLYSLWYFKNGTTGKLEDDVLFMTDPDADETVRLITGRAYGDWLEHKSFGALFDHRTEGFQTDLEQRGVVLPSGSVMTIPASALPMAGDAGQAKIMLTENAAAVLMENGDLHLAVIKNKTVGEFSLEAQKAGLIPAEGNERLYYQANSYKVGNRKYADLYVFENGKSLCLGKELVNDSPVLFGEEGGMLACTDYQSGRGRELTLFTQNGDAKYIADGVTDFKWVSRDEIVYLSDGDLYLYRRGTHIRLKNEVEQFWTNGEMKGRALHFEVVTY